MSTHNNDETGFRAQWQVWLTFKLAWADVNQR